MATNSIFSYFTSFIPGLRLVDGGDLKTLTNFLFSTTPSAVVALAGGGLSSSTPALSSAINWVGTVTSNNDSVVLPPALPGMQIVVINDGASTLAVFGNSANPGNNGVADKVVAHGGLSSAAATSQTQATTISAAYICFTPGLWKQFLSA